MIKDFPIVRKGYDPLEVDSYIASLQNELKAYKEKEQAITQAIVSAQMISEQLISKAKEEAQQIKNDAKIQLSKMQDMLNNAEENLKIFQEEYTKLVSKYLVQHNESNIQSLIEEVQSIRESFTLKEDEVPNLYEGTQAQHLSEKINHEPEQGLSKEELDSLFGKN